MGYRRLGGSRGMAGRGSIGNTCYRKYEERGPLGRTNNNKLQPVKYDASLATISELGVGPHRKPPNPPKPPSGDAPPTPAQSSPTCEK